jgi:hypothetical protein
MEVFDISIPEKDFKKVKKSTFIMLNKISGHNLSNSRFHRWRLMLNNTQIKILTSANVSHSTN